MPNTWFDMAWQTAFRLGFPLARLWWRLRLRRRPHAGALVAIHVGQALLLVRSSYRIAWNFPGGGLRRGETPEAAARRELSEEIGLTPETALLAAGDACGVWDGRQDRVHFFELRLDRLPALQLDHREIVAAQLFSPGELRGVAVTGPVAAYLERRCLVHVGHRSTWHATQEPDRIAVTRSTSFNQRKPDPQTNYP